MNSNYMFAFNRRQMGPAPSLDGPVPGPVPGPKSSPNGGPGDRFSINRLIHYKSAGGCRSCN